jgi:DNA-binding NarL/FixJ family response regulator
MGGALSVVSSTEKGTTFKLQLPAGATQEPSVSLSPQAVAVERRGRFLIIDDEEMVLNAVARILNHHEIVCMAHAREGLDRLKSDDRFDIVFCDLMMPSMTGIEFYEELLVSRPEIASRVVFLTGGAMTSKAAEFLRIVPNERVQKPFGVNDLRTMVQQILAANEAELNSLQD